MAEARRAEPRGEALRGQLEDALALVAEEAPDHFAALRRDLGERAAVIQVGDASPLRLCVVGEAPWVGTATGAEPDAAIRLALSESELSRLLRGQTSIEDAILHETLSARGALADLLAFFDGLVSWLHGALRSPSLPKLHQRCLAEKGPPPC